MDRNMLLSHLAQAEAHASRGATLVARQREIVTELESKGYETTDATRLLVVFEDSQQLHLDHVSHLQCELQRLDNSQPRGR